MKKLSVPQVASAALIAALYTVLTIFFASISFGPIQCRISEALTILPYFSFSAVPGVTIGCLLSNLLNGAEPLDIVFGTLATLLGALGTYFLRKKKWLAPIPPILANTILIPWVLRLAYGTEGTIPWLMLTIGLGEVLSCGVLGMILLNVLAPHKDKLF